VARGLPSGLATDRQSDSPEPVVLVRIATGVASPTFLRYGRRGLSETFDGETFTHRLFELDAGAVRGTSDAPTRQLRLDDSDGYLAGLVVAGVEFQGQEVEVFETYAGGLGGAGDDSQLDVYIVDFYEQAGHVLALTLKPLHAAFDEEIPRRKITRDVFPGIPREA